MLLPRALQGARCGLAVACFLPSRRHLLRPGRAVAPGLCAPRTLRGPTRCPVRRFFIRSKANGFCSAAFACSLCRRSSRVAPGRRSRASVPVGVLHARFNPKGRKPKCTANEPPTPVVPFLSLLPRNRGPPKPIYVPVAQGNLALDRTKPLEEFAPAMRSTKRSAAKNSGATNSGTSVLSFFEQPIKPNDTKRQRLNKLVTRQAMEIKLPQKENEALRMENEIFKEATDKHASSLTKLQSKIKSLQRSLTNAQQPAKKKQRTMSNGSGGARQICVRGTPAPRALALRAPNGALRSSVPPRGESRARIASL